MKSLLTTREWTILVSIVVYSFVPVFGGLIRFLELVGGPAIMPENPRAMVNPLPVVFHVLGSSVFCIAGVFQFLPSVRRHRRSTHRAMGRIVIIAGYISAASGLWMTWIFPFPDALQGILLFSARTILGFAMIGLIGWAVVAIRVCDVQKHGALMLRAYAIGQGASTQALFGIGWIAISGNEPAGLIRDVFMVFSWLLNLLIAEILIRRFIMNMRTPNSNWSLCQRKRG